MTDSSATAAYRGQGLTTAGWQAAAERRNADAENNDMTSRCDTDVSLTGPDGQAYGHEVGSKVPNLTVEHHSRPARTHNLPADHMTNQNPLSRGLRRGRAGRRGK